MLYTRKWHKFGCLIFILIVTVLMLNPLLQGNTVCRSLAISGDWLNLHCHKFIPRNFLGNLDLEFENWDFVSLGRSSLGFCCVFVLFDTCFLVLFLKALVEWDVEGQWKRLQWDMNRTEENWCPSFKMIVIIVPSRVELRVTNILKQHVDNRILFS